MKNRFRSFLSFTLFTILTFSAQCIFAQQDFHISIEPAFGIRNGQINEFVYRNTPTNYAKLSELNWDITNIFYLGGKTELEYKNFSFAFSAAGAIPKRSGNMQDSDWMDDSKTNIKTTYSISENSLDNSYYINLGFNYKIPLADFFSLKTSLNYNFENFSFIAKNGYGWYGNKKDPMVSWNNPNAIKYSKGEIGSINYERKSNDISFGLTPIFNIKDLFEIELFGAISIFSYLESLDYHFYPDGKLASNWLDKGTTFFNSWNAGGAILFYPIRKFAVKTEFKYSQINFFKGNTYQKSGNYFSNPPSPVLSGFSQNYYTFQLSLIYRPF